MKRALFFFLSLFLVTAVVFISALVTIVPTAEQVTFTANPLYSTGDPSDAQGLRLVAETTMDGKLNWTTTFTPAQSPSCETTFRFAPQEKSISYQSNSDGPQLSVWGQLNTIYYHGDLMSNDPYTYATYREMIEDVIGRTPTQGGSYTATVNLQDYLQYYPISLECGDWGYSDDSRQNYPHYEAIDLSSVFSIPIQAGITAEVSVTVQPDGSISEFSFYAPDMPYCSAKAVYFQDAFYVAFPHASLDLELDDTEVAPGLYRLPLTITNETTVVDVANIELVAPMDAPAQTMSLIGEGPQMALVTSANQQHPNQLTILDLTTGTQIQQLDLGDTNQINSFYAADDHITYAGSKKVGQEIVRGVIMAWRRGEDGTFSPVISTSLPDPSPIYSRSITSILQGDTLYTLTYAGGGDCSYIFVAVYTPQGCCYSADLTLSQYFDSSDNHSITLTGLRLECVPTP